MATEKGKKEKVVAGPSYAKLHGKAKAYAITDQFAPVEKDLLQSLKDLGKAKKTEDSATSTRSEATMALFSLAKSVADSCTAAEIDLTTAAQGFAAEMDALSPRLARANWPYIEKGQAKDGSTVYRWKGYGGNVKSWAKGLIEFGLDPAECIPEGKDSPTVSEVRDRITAERKAEKMQRTPGLAQLEEAKSLLSDAVKDFRQVVLAYGDDDHTIVECAGRLAELTGQIVAEQQAQDEADRKAKKAETDAIKSAVEESLEELAA